LPRKGRSRYHNRLLARLYEAVRHVELAQKDADRQLDYVRGQRIRLLGDRVLRRVAWRIAVRRGGCPDTYAAEYVALTELQADAFVILDPALAREVAGLVSLASFDDLIEGAR
jgi:hypothetical protein